MSSRTEIHIASNTYVTQQARDYIREKRLSLIVDGEPPVNREIRPAPEMAAGRFQTESGEALSGKPEHMTHLHGNVLVPKTHPRIALRGCLAWRRRSSVLRRGRTGRERRRWWSGWKR